MSVSVRAFRKVASGLDAFIEAAADGDEATAPLAAIKKAPLAIAISGCVALKPVISAGVFSHSTVSLF